MSCNRHIRALLAGLERTTQDHRRKLALERAERIPNEGLIATWESDIAVFEKQRARLLRRDW